MRREPSRNARSEEMQFILEGETALLQQSKPRNALQLQVCFAALFFGSVSAKAGTCLLQARVRTVPSHCSCNCLAIGWSHLRVSRSEMKVQEMACVCITLLLITLQSVWLLFPKPRKASQKPKSSPRIGPGVALFQDAVRPLPHHEGKRAPPWSQRPGSRRTLTDSSATSCPTSCPKNVSEAVALWVELLLLCSVARFQQSSMSRHLATTQVQLQDLKFCSRMGLDLQTPLEHKAYLQSTVITKPASGSPAGFRRKCPWATCQAGHLLGSA